MLLKKMAQTLDTLESSSEITVYALDETSVRVESENRSCWSTVGVPPILEKNGSHKGISIVGSTCILNKFHTINDVYPSGHSITSKEIKSHLEHLIEMNNGKKVVVFLDNARIHTSAAMQEWYFTKKDQIQLIFLPRYSPDMNPQENMWNYLKAKLFKPSSRNFIEELILDAKEIFDELNKDFERIGSLVYARSFLV